MTIDELKEYVHSLDIIDILIKLELISEDDIDNRKMLCPFHDEKTPSLNFYEETFYCFGCQEQGDVFKFIMDSYDCSFLHACELIAEVYNKDLSFHSNTNPFLKNKTTNIANSILEEEWKMYVNDLEKSPNEVQERAVDFFPLEVGFDKRINYFVFRYTSKSNKTLGFTKRRAFELQNPEDKNKYPKWRHSAKNKTNIGQCRNIYNLGGAVKYIRNKKEVIICEGPKDIIPFLLNNHKEVIAVSGVSNVKKSLEILPQFKKITLALDDDEAGKKGIIAFIKELGSSIDLDNIYCFDLKGLDPYDYYNKYDKLPDKKQALDFLTKEDLKQFYNFCSDYNKEKIIKYLLEKEHLSYEQAKSYFEMGDSPKPRKKSEDELSELVKQGDEEAQLKLKIKFGVT